MRLGELLGKYMRLQTELAATAPEPSVQNRHAERISDEMARVAEALHLAPVEDEQATDTLPGLQYLYE